MTEVTQVKRTASTDRKDGTSAKPRKPNYAHVLGGSVYLVRTVGGYKRAIKAFWGSRTDEFVPPSNIPTSYPTVVAFSSTRLADTEKHMVFASYMHVNTFKNILKDH